MKKFIRNLSFAFDVKLYFLPLKLKLTHATWMVWEQGCNPDYGIVMGNYVCMCVNVYNWVVGGPTV